MIYAYDKIYLSRAQGLLAVMFDFAVYDLHESLSGFFDKFLYSNVSRLFETGDTSTLAGKSGIELTLDVINDYSKSDCYNPRYDKTPEFWTGWALAYFQWYSNLPFYKINSYIPITQIREMYNPFHEMDISQFCDHLIELYNSRKPTSNLKNKRMNAGLSQSELAYVSEVPVRTIQQYEQKQKNINSACAETLVKLSKSLYCSVEDLLEIN